MNPFRLRSRETAWVLILLAGSILLFWWRIWIPTAADRMHFTDDIYVKDYPTRLGLYRILLSGHLPLWDPYQFGGWPGIANCEAGFFYPFNALLIPFVDAPQTAFSATELLVLLHFCIAGLGMYRLSRYVGISPYGAGLAAATFTFCGFHCAHKKHTNMIFTLVWLPWILLQAERWIREKSTRFLRRTILLLALAFTAGHPQSALYMSLILAARILYAHWTLNADPPVFSIKKIVLAALPAGFVLVAAIALTAVQWFPTWELIQQGERAAADQFLHSTEYSLPPLELLDVILPEALRSWSQVEIFYWGIIPLSLAVLFSLRNPLDSFQRFLIGTAILCVLFALGENLFLYDLSYIVLPGIAWVRAPSRWIYFAGLPIALLAGCGVDRMIAQPKEWFERNGWESFHRQATVWIGLAAFLLFLVENRLDLAENRVLLQSLILLLLFLGFFLGILSQTARQKWSPQTTAVLLIFLTWIDLGTHYHTLDLNPGAGGYTLNPTIQSLLKSAWNSRTKVFLGGGMNRTDYHGAAQNFRELDGQSPLTPRLQLQLRQDTSPRFPDKPNMALFKLCNVNAMLTDVPQLPPPFRSETHTLFLMDTPAVRARILTDEFYVESDVARSLLSIQSFPFDRIALSEKSPPRESHSVLPPEALFSKPFLLISSSSESVQAAAHLIMDGKDHFADMGGESGYYMAYADSQTGLIEEKALFNLQLDLHDPSHNSNRRLWNFIRKIPEGKTVFAAIKDNAANMLFPQGLAALQAIGAAVDVRSRYRWAHVIVGKKGAPIGSALEILSPTEALVIQTEKSVTTAGSILERTTPQLYADIDHAEAWDKFWAVFDADKILPKRFAAEVNQPTPEMNIPLPVPITVFSSPKKSQVLNADDRASIRIGGEEYAKNGVGYNLAVMDPKTGKVVASDGFNIELDYNPATGSVREASEENCRMTAFIHSVTEGYVVLGAIRDEATILLQPQTVEALHNLGSKIVIEPTPELRFRLSHAFVGVKGASRCIEAFRKEQNAVIYTRYPGAPYPTVSDLAIDTETYKREWRNIDPVEEVLSQSSKTKSFASIPPGKVWMVEENGPNQLNLSGNTATAGLLYVSEIWYPGWEVRVDGVLQPMERVNYYFRGVRIPAGVHDVEMKYVPLPFWNGLKLSGIAWLLMFLWMGIARRQSVMKKSFKNINPPSAASIPADKIPANL